MAKQKQERCPGCSRHCVQGCEHCKYGRKYFAALEEKKAKAAKPIEEERRYKWEKNVTLGSSVWRLLWLSCQMKKALRKGTCTEERFITTLDQTERQQLEAILKKLQGCLDQSKYF